MAFQVVQFFLQSPSTKTTLQSRNLKGAIRCKFSNDPLLIILPAVPAPPSFVGGHALMAGSRPRAASLVATPLWLEKSHAKPAPSVGVGSARGGCRSPSENASSLPCFTGLCRRPSVARRLGRLSVTSRPDQKDSMATTYTRIQYGSARERKRGHACGTARSIPVSTLEHRQRCTRRHSKRQL